MNASIRFDAEELLATLRKLDGDVTEIAVARGLFQAGNALLKDAIYQPPMAPKLVGDLRGSAATLGSEMVEIGEKAAKKAPSSFRAIKSRDELSVYPGFNIVYAAKQHEWPEGMEINWSTPPEFPRSPSSPGRKYLESKLMIFGKRYTEIIGEYIKELLASLEAKRKK